MVINSQVAEKLVTILNRTIEDLGYVPENEGFATTEDGQILALDEGDIVSFEEGLDFILSEQDLNVTAELLKE